MWSNVMCSNVKYWSKVLIWYPASSQQYYNIEPILLFFLIVYLKYIFFKLKSLLLLLNLAHYWNTSEIDIIYYGDWGIILG